MLFISSSSASLHRPRRLAGLFTWLLTGTLLLGAASCATLPRPRGVGMGAAFAVGTCVNVGKLQANAAYRTTIEREFSSVTAETDMKMDVIQPRLNTFEWTKADALVRFARQHRQRVHGHALVWHGSTPKWVEQFPGDTAAWDGLLRQHIQTTVGHFKKQVKAWDVVNEALEGDGSLSHTVWYNHLGPSYVARAFRYARQAAPQALLFYNDWDIEGEGAKLNGALALLARLKAQGIRVDGVGFQLHTSVGASVGTVSAAMQKVAALGYLVHLSEVDVELNRQGQLGAATQPPAEALAQQRQFVRDLVAAYRQLPPARQYGITFWGVSDGDTWLRGFKHHPEWPLLFDEQYQPKPAYEGFREGVAAPVVAR